MKTAPTFTMDRTAVAVHRMGEELSDRAYWMGRPPEERWAAVEFLRATYHGWTDDARPRLQRVLRHAERA